MTDVISLRLSEEQLKAVDAIVDSGEFGTRAEFVKYCVRMTLKQYNGRSPPPLVTEGSPTGLIAAPAGVRLDASRPSIGVKRLNGWLTTARC